jgi:hypothetical protein
MGLRGLANDDFYIFNQTAAANNLILSESTGAATFSSSVTANSSIISTTAFGGTFRATDGTNEVRFGSYFNTIGSGNSYDGVIYTTNALSTFSILTGGSTSARLFINSTGNVGINTTSPVSVAGQTSLTVNGTNVGRYDIYVNGTHNSQYLSTSTELQIGSLVNIPFSFYTNSAERMRITAGGNLLIGTTTDAGQKLQVNGTIYSAFRFNAPGNNFDPTASNNWVNAAFSTIANASPYGGGIALIDGTAGFCQWLDGSGANFRIGYATTTSNPTSQFLLTSAGNVAVAGSIQTGAPTTGTAAAWKLGSRVAAAVALDATQYIQVEVGGTFYKLAIVT